MHFYKKKLSEVGFGVTDILKNNLFNIIIPFGKYLLNYISWNFRLLEDIKGHLKETENKLIVSQIYCIIASPLSNS